MTSLKYYLKLKEVECDSMTHAENGRMAKEWTYCQRGDKGEAKTGDMMTGHMMRTRWRHQAEDRRVWRSTDEATKVLHGL